ncbi:MAG: hypothetical protein RR603_07255 [Kurthia sp.]
MGHYNQKTTFASLNRQAKHLKTQTFKAQSEAASLRLENKRLHEALAKVMEVEAPNMEGWETCAYKIARQALEGGK